ncbi:MAG TPA: hypothetical protein VK034_22310, partial [Enhygromyxa sp.]|nr:hypothetical protein [Enhygromyxa sp.]
MHPYLRLAPLALALIPLLPRPAQACDPNPCFISDKWQSFRLTSTTVGTDGVLVLDGRRGPNAWALTDAEALAYLDMQVTADGEPIAGTLEVSEGWRGVVWRPDAPLPAGAALS